MDRYRQQGTQHRPDDVSRVPPKIPEVAKQHEKRTITDTGNIVPTTSAELWFSMSYARRIREYNLTLTANSSTLIQFDTTSCAVEIINDTTTTSTIGVAFQSDTPVLPSPNPFVAGGNSIATTQIKNGEARYYNVHVDQLTVKAGSVQSNVRVTVALP